MNIEHQILKINNWDKQDINELKILLDEFKIHLLQDQGDFGSSRIEDFVNISNLPTVDIPNNIEGYPIWSMDINGNCLVGDTMDSIESIEEIREWYLK